MNILRKEDFPQLLREIHAPPTRLFYRGNLEVLRKTCIAVVGTRHNTEYGEYMTKSIIEDLSILDVAIVSGLASGIDTIAHRAAIENGLPTIAVLGSGLDNIYPKSNRSLAEECDLLLSEYPAKMSPRKHHFPKRNCIVSGLAVATVVIEAPEKSGALITANQALQQGRDIYVVPGDVDRVNSKGITKLLQSGGAYPILSGKEIIESLSQQPHLFHFSTSKTGATNTPTSNTTTPNTASSSNTANLNTLPLSPLDSFPSIPEAQIAASQIPYKLTKNEEAIFKLIPTHRGISFEKIKGKSPALPAQKILSSLTTLELYGLIKNRNNKYRRPPKEKKNNG